MQSKISLTGKIQKDDAATFDKTVDFSVVNGDFFTRFNSIQTWFLRVASQVKLKFLIGMFETIKDRELMPYWFRLLNKERFDKLIGYGDVLTKAHLPYDKLLNDHNRALDDDEVEKILRNDLEWFKNYDEDYQEEIFLSLISMSGGAIMRNISKYMAEYYKIAVLDPTRFSKNQPSPIKMVPSSKSYDDLDPNITADAEVIKKKAEWEKLMENYEQEIWGYPGNKAEPKKAKPEKKVKQSKGKDDTIIDFIQTMPIWIVLKILRYLDAKTLKEASNVNSYWAYAVQCLNKEREERIALNKLIRKMEEEIDINAILSSAEIYKKEEKCKKQDKFARLEREGTVHRKIIEKLKVPEPLCYSSVIIEAVNQMPAEYVLPVEGLTTFGRKFPDEEQKYSVYQFPSCVIYEGGQLDKVDASQLPKSGNIDVTETYDVLHTKASVQGEGASQMFATTDDNVLEI